MGPKTGPEGAKTRFSAPVSGSGPKSLGDPLDRPDCLDQKGSALAGCLKLLDALEDLDDVRSVSSNLEADAEAMETAVSLG